MSESAFRPLTTAEKIFKDVVFDPMIRAGEAWLEGAFSFFSLPVVKQLEEHELQAILDGIYLQLCMFIDIESIRLVDAEKQRAFEDASTRLHLVIAQYGPESPEFQKANEDEKAAFAALFTRHIR